MKLKKLTAIALAAAMTIGTSMTSMAAGWQQNSTGWWYGTNADNSTWHSNGWQWIDGNGDGVAECYYFDANGYMLANTTTPDGYMVDGNGAWTVNGQIQTQGTGNAGNSSVNGAQHSAGYDPAHPLAHKIDEFGLRLPQTLLTGTYAGGTHNVQALLTNQMSQYYIAPVTDPGWTTEADYYDTVNNTQAIYKWFCDWLNGMDWENMTEMERAQEIEKVLGACKYDREGEQNPELVNKRNGYCSVFIDKKGVCSEFALAACVLAKTLGLKSGISGTGNHTIYYIEADGNVYLGSNQVLDLRYPRTGIVGLH